MSGKNPFKIIEEENIRNFEEKGPKVPVFLEIRNNSSITNYNPGLDLSLIHISEPTRPY